MKILTIEEEVANIIPSGIVCMDVRFSSVGAVDGGML